jgi:quercetin dioxygenase-like cupin family protein
MKGIQRFPNFVSQLTEADVPFEGVSAHLIQSDHSQVVFLEFPQAVEVSEHSHQEQWEFVIAGCMRLYREGNEEEFRAGDNFFIPASVVHSAKVSAGYKALIIFNEPDRYVSK